jgi:hypothetical protein
MTAFRAPPAYQPPAESRPHPKTNGLAIASLSLGLLGVPISWITLAVPSILALIFGIVGLRAIKRSGGAQKGTGLAISGLTLGAVFIIIPTLIWGLTFSTQAGRDGFREGFKNGMESSQQANR